MTDAANRVSPIEAPELRVSAWLNTPEPLSLKRLRGRVVVLHAFQMLCPGCVSHGLPQAQQIHELFSPEDVAVIGLHTVFEHHAAMTRVSLEAFVHEYRLSFPIGIDEAAAQGDVPLTMQTYGMRGTPSMVLIDRNGHIRLHEFGRLPDLAVGAAVAQLVAQPMDPSLKINAGTMAAKEDGCGPDGCALDGAAK
ncbi:MAG TPA: redoxin domain-containing protein [Burkholderiaceae bacterium]|nr:redoxin domain-containing protein [Burkholderiaceae bacterium]